MRCGLTLVGALISLCVLLLPATGAAAAPTPTPAWSVQVSTYPTNLAPGTDGTIYEGPGYFIRAVNVGGAPTTGPYTLTDTLPDAAEGLTFGEPAEAEVARSLAPLSCSVAGQTTTCTGSATIQPGEVIMGYVPVDVAANAPDGVINRVEMVGGGATTGATTAFPTPIGEADAPFGFLAGRSGLSYGEATTVSGASAAQAGSHPYRLSVGLGFPAVFQSAAYGFGAAGGGVKDVQAALPEGVAVNPTATPVRCTELELESDNEAGGGCPPASQVGTVTVTTAIYNPGIQEQPLYNMVPPHGSPAELGFDAIGSAGLYVHVMGSVRTGTDYGITGTSDDILSRPLNPVLGAVVNLWGDPSDESHDFQRVCVGEGPTKEPCATDRTNKAFVTQPSACSGPQTATATATDWDEPAVVHGARTESTDTTGNPVGIEGCSRLPFEASLAVKPEVSEADSPTGLEVDIHVPQNEEYEDEATGEPRLAEANLKDTRVTLPEGLVVNPSAAAGLEACSESQVGYEGVKGGRETFTSSPAECPAASKLGSVEVDTPLLEHPLPGAVYLARQGANPFNSLLALYIAVHDPETGVVIKLAGKVEPDQQTGRLTATFDENPQLPFEDFKLDFFGGPRASLRTPAVCAGYDAEGEFTPWSGTAPVDAVGPFSIGQGAGGGACANSAATEPNQPGFEAGTKTPLAGAFSPFVLKISRADGSQELKELDVTLPPGLTGKLAGIPYCPDAAIAAASSRTGIEERQSPSCPSASEVGTVTVGAGSGPQPYYVSGHAYLAGPYKGAPLSLAIITPAVAGPFDLGTVVVRAGLYVNQETAQITVRSDAIPSILQGIPLDIRSIAVSISREGFTLNPTSCEAMAVGGESVSTQGQAAKLSNRFQVGGCKALPFAPKLKLQVIGKTNRNAKPRLKAVLTTRPGEANIRRAQVNLPHSLFLEQGHIGTTCTRVQWAEGNGNGSACPKASIYGRAVAWTPLLEKPLEGYVYLRSNGGERKLPDLVAGLNGQIQIALWGKVDTGHNKGLRNTFEVVPDAPVSRFVLELNGKKKGLLVNSEPLCAKKAKRQAIVRFTGQNGKVEQFKPKVAASCGGGKKSRGGR